MRGIQRIFGLLLILALAACGGTPHRYVGLSAPVECVPFARALSGIDLRGDAAGWWRRADGRYARGQAPEVGAVMVFASTSRLPAGHVAVVSRVMSRREIMVTQANWVRHHVTTDQMVADVSPYGDWSSVQVWWPPAAAMGSTVYPVNGFIYSGRPVSHDSIARAVPRALEVALNQ